MLHLENPVTRAAQTQREPWKRSSRTKDEARDWPRRVRVWAEPDRPNAGHQNPREEDLHGDRATVDSPQSNFSGIRTSQRGRSSKLIAKLEVGEAPASIDCVVRGLEMRRGTGRYSARRLEGPERRRCVEQDGVDASGAFRD